MKHVIYDKKAFLSYKNQTSKKIYLVNNGSISDELYCKLFISGIKGVEIISYKELLKGKYNCKTNIFFVCSFNDMEYVCRELRVCMDEGKDYFCLRPIKFYSIKEDTNWKDVEFFNVVWENRIKKMVSLISPEIKNVIDLGCGEERLKNNLTDDINYYGVDYQKRSNNTIVCDFNSKEFPDLIKNNIVDRTKTAYFCSGCFEYMEAPEWFISQLTDAEEIIISYTTWEHRNLDGRTWVFKNNFTAFEIYNMLSKHGYFCENALFFNGQIIFKFKR